MSARTNNPRSHDDHVELSLYDLLAKLWRRKLLFSLFLLVGFALGFYVYQRRPTYSSTGTMLVQKAQNSSLQEISAGLSGLSGRSFSGINKDLYLEKYLLYLGSRDFFLSVADQLAGMPDYQEYLEVLDVETVNSTSRLSNLFGRSKKRSEPRSEDEILSDVAASLADRTVVGRNGSSGIDITIVTNSPENSFELATLLIDVGTDLIVKRELKELDEAKAYLSQKLEECEVRLKEINQSQVQVRKRNSMTMASIKGDAGSQIEAVMRDLENAKIRLDQNKVLMDKLTGQIKADDAEDLAGGAESSTGTSLAKILGQQLEGLKQRRVQYVSEGISESSEKITLLDKEISATRKKLSEQKAGVKNTVDGDFDFAGDGVPLADKLATLQNENILLTTRIESTTKSLNKLTLKKQSLPQDEQLYFDMSKRSELQYLMFAELSKQIFQIDIQRISVQNKIGTIEKPSLRKLQRRPGLVSCVIIALFFSTVLCFFVIMVLEHRNPVVMSSADVSALNLAIFGVVPDLHRALARGARYFTGDHPRVRHDMDTPNSVVFKHLRTRILLAVPPQSQGRVVTILSSVSGEGKSFLTRHLAESMACLGHRVLLLDCDVRGHGLSDFYLHDSAKGVSTLLAGKSRLDEVILKGLRPNLDLLPSGPFSENITELVMGRRFAEIVAEVKARYDYVFIDTPPAVPVPDAMGIVTVSDLDLVVVLTGKTRMADLALSSQRLAQMTGKTLMAVLNRTNDAPTYYYSRRPLPSKAPTAKSTDDKPGHSLDGAA